MARPLILHCEKCGVFRSHHTVDGADRCETCDTKHPDPFAFGELTPQEISFCYLLHDEYLRGILTEYPPKRTR